MRNSLILLICTFSGACLINIDLKRKRPIVAGNDEELGPDPKTEDGYWEYSASSKKLRDYEQTHYADYLKNKGAYESWSELNNLDQRSLCLNFVGKLFRRASIVKVIAKVLSSVTLFYERIKDDNGDQLPNVNIVGLRCHVPQSTKNKYYYYIRSPKPHCLLLTKPGRKCATKNAISPDVLIINEFCDKFQEQDSEDSDLESQQFKRWKYISNEEASLERITAYEKALFLSNTDESHSSWPALDDEEKKIFCKTFLRQLLVGIQFAKVETQIIRSAIIRYSDYKCENSEEPSPKKVSVLQCYFSELSKRKYFHYIEAPTPHCVYLVKPIPTSASGEFRLVNEFCDAYDTRAGHLHKTSDEMNSEISGRKIPINQKWNGEVAPEVQAIYEVTHLQQYFIDKDTYEKWPELHSMDTKERDVLCQTYIKRVLRRNLFHKTLSKVMPSLTLHYVRINFQHGRTLFPVNITALKCYHPGNQLRSYFYFIRSPSPNCLLLVKSLTKNYHVNFRIASQLCDIGVDPPIDNNLLPGTGKEYVSWLMDDSNIEEDFNSSFTINSSQVELLP